MIIVDIIVIALAVWAVVKFLQHDDREQKREQEQPS